MSFIERLSDIELAMINVITSQTSGMANIVVLNKRIKVSDMKPPMVWILPEESQISDSALSLSEDWSLTFWIISIIKGHKDTTKLMKDAEALALKASSGLLADRTLGGLVEDITRIGWSPGDSRVMEADETLYGAAVRVKLKVLNREVC